MLDLDKYYYWDLMEQNRKELNSRFLHEIKKTENKLINLFFNMLDDPRISQTKIFIEKLKQENAKPTRIKWREFHYQHLNNIQKSVLKLLRQFFDKNFPEIAWDPKIWWLYFNEDLKDIVWFDLIFWYVPHNSITSDDVDTYRAKFFLKWWYKQNKKEDKIEDTKPSKEKIWLPRDHKLLNMDTYDKYKEQFLVWIKYSIESYSKTLNINIEENNVSKIFIEKYFIYIIKESLLNNKLVLNIKSSKNMELIKYIIQETINYINDDYSLHLNIDIWLASKKFLRNLNSDQISPLEFTYQNTLANDVLKREEYFDNTYFSQQDTSSKIIYSQIIEEFWSKEDKIKLSHAIQSPDYFVLKNKKEKLESDLYILNWFEPKDISLQNIIDSKQQDLIEIMTKMDNHFYSKIEKESKSFTGDSMEKITQKYMKYYKIPIQYRKNFFIVINYLNHYYKLNSDIKKNAEKHNQELEKKLLNSPNFNKEFIDFIREYMTFQKIKVISQEKREKSLIIRLNNLKRKILDPKINTNKAIQDTQLKIDF